MMVIQPKRPRSKELGSVGKTLWNGMRWTYYYNSKETRLLKWWKNEDVETLNEI